MRQRVVVDKLQVRHESSGDRYDQSSEAGHGGGQRDPSLVVRRFREVQSRRSQPAQRLGMGRLQQATEPECVCFDIQLLQLRESAQGGRVRVGKRRKATGGRVQSQGAQGRRRGQQIEAHARSHLGLGKPEIQPPVGPATPGAD